MANARERDLLKAVTRYVDEGVSNFIISSEKAILLSSTAEKKILKRRTLNVHEANLSQ